MTRTLLLFAIGALSVSAQVMLPSGTLNVTALNAAGSSFVHSGTLTQASTIQFVVTQNPCLQAGPNFCVNGAGVIVSGGTIGSVGPFAGTIMGTSGTWSYGALLMNISGVGTVQVFPSNATNGAGSGSPPTSLTLAATPLSSLGYGAFSVSNPTITFLVADTGYTDNSGQFVLAQSVAPPAAPLPTSLLLMMVGLVCLGALYFARQQRFTHTA